MTEATLPDLDDIEFWNDNKDVEIKVGRDVQLKDLIRGIYLYHVFEYDFNERIKPELHLNPKDELLNIPFKDLEKEVVQNGCNEIKYQLELEYHSDQTVLGDTIYFGFTVTYDTFWNIWLIEYDCLKIE